MAQLFNLQKVDNLDKGFSRADFLKTDLFCSMDDLNQSFNLRKVEKLRSAVAFDAGITRMMCSIFSTSLKSAFVSLEKLANVWET